MKAIRYIAIAAALIASTSCMQEWLTTESTTSLESSKSIIGVPQVEFALNGIYNVMRDPYAYSGRLVYYGDVTGDDMMAQSSSKRCGSYYRFSNTKDNAPNSHWQYLYNIIQNCNVTLNALDGMSVSGDDKETADDYRGELLAIRGMAYFDLVKIYGVPYTKDNGASLGVPLVLGTSAISDKPKRNTVAEVYTQVIDDLTKAVDLLSTSYKKGKINKYAAQALLSRVYLYHNDNQKAYDTAVAAINGAEKAGYKLWTNAEYPTAWGNDFSSSQKGEVLFELVIPTEEGLGKETMGYLRSILDEAQVPWQVGELGRIDVGGGGTIASEISIHNLDTIDMGVPVLSMHAPMEVTSKVDDYLLYKAMKAFFACKVPKDF